MTTNYHTPYEDDVTQYKQAHMNSPLGELDLAITNAFDEIDEAKSGILIVCHENRVVCYENEVVSSGVGIFA